MRFRVEYPPLGSCLLLFAALILGSCAEFDQEEDEFSPVGGSEELFSPLFSNSNGRAGGEQGTSGGGSGDRAGAGGVWGDGKVSLRGLWSFQWAKQEVALGSTEYLAITVVLLYMVVHIWGRRRNYEIAHTFIRGVHGLFCSRFLEAGPAAELPPADRRQLLSRDSPSTFLYYATGSRACDGVLVRIDLANRHDLFLLGWSLFSPVHDTVTIEVALDDEDIEPLVFAITPKRGQRQLLQEVPHIADYASVVRASLLPQGLICLSESAALMEALIQPPVDKILAEYPNLLEVMYVTDQNEDPILGRKDTPKKTMRFRFRLPPVKGNQTGDLRGAAKMVELMLHYVESLHKFKMYPGMRKKAIERRDAVAKRKFKMTHAQRQERFQQLKNERLQKEREEYENLTPEQKRRRDLKDEKRAKRAANSRKPRLKLTKG